MQFEKIAWAEYDPALREEGSIVDPLGFQNIAEVLADTILPNITTRTRRIRYYTILCWSLRIIADNKDRLLQGQFDSAKNIEKIILKMEKLYALSVVSHYKEQLPTEEKPLLGSDLARDYYRKVELQTREEFKLDNDFRFLRNQRAQGAFGAYKTSMIGMHFIDSKDYHLLGNDDLGGAALAKNLVRSTKTDKLLERIVVRAIQNNSVTKYSLEALGHHFCLNPAFANNQEVKILSQAIRSNPSRRECLNAIDFSAAGELKEMEVIDRAIRRSSSEKQVVSELELLRDFEYFCCATGAILEDYIMNLRSGLSPAVPNAHKSEPVSVYNLIVAKQAGLSYLGLELLELIKVPLSSLAERIRLTWNAKADFLDDSSYLDDFCVFISDAVKLIRKNSSATNKIDSMRKVVLARHLKLKRGMSWIKVDDTTGKALPNRQEGEWSLSRSYRINAATSLLLELKRIDAA